MHFPIFSHSGGFVANFLLGGLGKSYGLIMDAFQEVYQSGSALFMLAGGLIYTLMFCLCNFSILLSETGDLPAVSTAQTILELSIP
ncbi:hypothetical protein T265_02256 [Opisthorchis viverrini]|uniref:Uncharacterized protein n=1 Tax=Opisthorchis viverrini TaxID=6198 RepID=A0A074ZZN9_OPIVI|nr:hypothetical protein T265_02256 [Opisthorchis viverrini]KER31482.1 hypothetical protein T265_02256 [Opisthorchis viverrini]